MFKTALVFALLTTFSVCTVRAQSITSPDALKQYLDRQPVNSPDKPIRVSMSANDLMIGQIAAVIKSAGKYVSLELTGNALTTIGRGAFDDCAGLASITIPNSVTSIGESAFAGCTGLTSITVSSGNPNYVSEGGILYNKAKTKFILIPRRITGNVTIPNSVTSIEEMAFYSCKSLTGITIPNSVTSIGKSAFLFCTSLASVTIGNGVTSIESYAFAGCTSLASVAIPDSVTSIGEQAFSSCRSLASINVVASNNAYTSENGVLYNKSKTTLVDYPCGKTGAFTIPNGVTRIGEYAFSGCTSLASVTIPASVTRIGGFAFDGCTSLTSVTFQGTITAGNLHPDAFGPPNNKGLIGDLRAKYLAGGPGTYTRTEPLDNKSKWTKQ